MVLAGGWPGFAAEVAAGAAPPGFPPWFPPPKRKPLLVWGPIEVVITWLGKALDEMMLGLAATGDHGTGWVR